MSDFSSVESLDLSGKRVVVAGGTQGIGAGIARFAAHLGAVVAIIGRNAALGDGLISNFDASNEASAGKHIFISADLATIHGAKQAAQRVKEWAGEESVFLLFQTQGGPPLTDRVTDDGLDFHFAIQALSRFVLPYTLAELGVLKDSTVVSIAGAGEAADTVDFDDFDAKGISKLSRSYNSLMVIDAFTKEFNNRYPSIRALHTWPGIVRTNIIANSEAPWFLRALASIIWSLPFMGLLGVRTADEYARIAMWLATSEEVQQKKEVVGWTQRGTEARLSNVAKDDKLRVQVWEKLVSITDDPSTI